MTQPHEEAPVVHRQPAVGFFDSAPARVRNQMTWLHEQRQAQQQQQQFVAEGSGSVAVPEAVQVAPVNPVEQPDA